MPRPNRDTGFYGVSLDHRNGRFYVRALRYAIGAFAHVEEAAQAYNDFVIRYDLGLPLNELTQRQLSDILVRKEAKLRTMKKPVIRNKARGPEDIIQEDIIKMLHERGWFVKILHGSIYQSGMPDLFAAKRQYGQRLIEVKNPVKFSFTPAQVETFPRLLAEGVGIWILGAATEAEYQKLFKPSNVWVYMAKLHNL